MKKKQNSIFKIRKSRELPKIAPPNGSVYTVPTSKDLDKMIRRAVQIQNQLDEVKPLYGELDQITSSLLNASIVSVKLRSHLEKQKIVLVDNFAEKNTAFRTVALRRYELKWKR